MKFDDLQESFAQATAKESELSTELNQAQEATQTALEQAFAVFPHDELDSLKNERETHHSTQVEALEKEAAEQIKAHSETPEFEASILPLRAFVASTVNMTLIFEPITRGGYGLLNGLAFINHIATEDELARIKAMLDRAGGRQYQKPHYERLGLKLKPFTKKKADRIKELESFLNFDASDLVKAQKELDKKAELDRKNKPLFASLALSKLAKPRAETIDQVKLFNFSEKPINFYSFEIQPHSEIVVPFYNYAQDIHTTLDKEAGRFNRLFNEGQVQGCLVDTKGAQFKMNTPTAGIRNGVYEL